MISTVLLLLVLGRLASLFLAAFVFRAGLFFALGGFRGLFLGQFIGDAQAGFFRAQPFTEDQLVELLRLARKGIGELVALQKSVLA